ncbi:hypothetical protein ACVZ9I_004320, partial [Shigella flexneri]
LRKFLCCSLEKVIAHTRYKGLSAAAWLTELQALYALYGCYVCCSLPGSDTRGSRYRRKHVHPTT